MTVKTKLVDIKVKAGPDDGLAEGQFIGYASVFGNIDYYGDIVAKGAFAKTLADWRAKSADIPVLWNHDMGDPFSNLGHVISAEEDEHGLKVHAQLDLENPKAAQVYRLLKGRRINQMSFAYDIINAEMVTADGQNAYELRELKLHEVTITPIGANQETEIVAVKAAAAALVDGLKAGRVLSTKNEESLRAAYESIGKVLESLPSQEEDGQKASELPALPDEEPIQAKSVDAPEDLTAVTALQAILLKSSL